MGSIQNTSHDNHSLEYDGVYERSFPVVASVTASHAITTVVAVLPLANNCQVVKVSAFYTAISGSPAINVVAGVGTPVAPVAPAALAEPETSAVVNTSVFASSQTLSNAANTVQTFYPTTFNQRYAGSWDAVGGTNNMLTLRYVTTGADTASNLTVTVALKDIDPNPTSQPYSPANH